VLELTKKMFGEVSGSIDVFRSFEAKGGHEVATLVVAAASIHVFDFIDFHIHYHHWSDKLHS
jgi:hypothetical protein